jgi:probable phosphoglycerate mutase
VTGRPTLDILHTEARQLVRKLGRVTFEHVRREINAHADRLANEAMDEAASGTPRVQD